MKPCEMMVNNFYAHFNAINQLLKELPGENNHTPLEDDEFNKAMEFSATKSWQCRAVQPMAMGPGIRC